MKTLIKKITFFGFIFSFANSAVAYDVDTHFYGTYSMARFAGIAHDVALKIATSAQWMDESYISDPVSMIIAAHFGAKKRRLLHFPGARLAGDMTTNIASGFMTMGATNQMAALTETQADDDFATEMFTEGLQEGNLMKAATGLHTLEDSFAHAGTFSEMGHAEFWHHPDRPFVDKESIEKYFAMSRSVFKALVAIRKLLPPEKIDLSINFSKDSISNAKREGAELADLYRSQEIVQKTISHDVFRDPIFVKHSVLHCFIQASSVGYVKPGYINLISIEPGESAFEAISRLSVILYNKGFIDLKKVMGSTGRPEDRDEDFVRSKGGKEKLISQIVTGLIAGTVPRNLSVYHRVEKEEDGYLWQIEMEIRVRRIQAMIRTMYGKDISFVSSHTSGFSGFLKENSLDPTPNPNVPSGGSGTEYITFLPNEKYAFNQMILKFLFPMVSEKYGNDLFRFSGYFTPWSQASLSVKGVKDHVKGAFTLGGAEFRALIQRDILESRLRANKYNTYYRYPDLTDKLIRQKIFVPIDFSVAFPDLVGARP